MSTETLLMLLIQAGTLLGSFFLVSHYMKKDRRHVINETVKAAVEEVRQYSDLKSKILRVEDRVTNLESDITHDRMEVKTAVTQIMVELKEINRKLEHHVDKHHTKGTL